tara:strand:+ start:401 stop:523 length:123 start_codon:yes stop_codon:yes gene_type:complete
MELSVFVERGPEDEGRGAEAARLRTEKDKSRGGFMWTGSS